MSIVGIATVFIILLAVATVSHLLGKLPSKKDEKPEPQQLARTKVAAMTAVHHYITFESRSPKHKVPATTSRWSSIARIEALGKDEEKFG